MRDARQSMARFFCAFHCPRLYGMYSSRQRSTMLKEIDIRA